jgi:Glycine zipper
VIQIDGKLEYWNVGIRSIHRRDPARRSRNQSSELLLHRRDAEFTETGAFLNQELFTLRPQRLRGEISEFLYRQTWSFKDHIELDMRRPLTIILVISFLPFFLGCSEPLTTTEKGAGIGTVTGAGLGAIIGSATGHAGAGAGIGAAIGLIGGALIGDQIQERQKQEQEIQQKMAAQQAEIDRAEQELQQLKQQEAR